MSLRVPITIFASTMAATAWANPTGFNVGGTIEINGTVVESLTVSLFGSRDLPPGTTGTTLVDNVTATQADVSMGSSLTTVDLSSPGLGLVRKNPGSGGGPATNKGIKVNAQLTGGGPLKGAYFIADMLLGVQYGGPDDTFNVWIDDVSYGGAGFGSTLIQDPTTNQGSDGQLFFYWAQDSIAGGVGNTNAWRNRDPDSNAQTGGQIQAVTTTNTKLVQNISLGAHKEFQGPFQLAAFVPKSYNGAFEGQFEIVVETND